MTPKENPSGILDLGLTEPNGNYDYFEITIDLLNTDSNRDYYFDTKLPANCNPKSKHKFSKFKNESVNTNVYAIDLCMLSNYNVTTKTVLLGYNTVAFSKLFMTSLY